MPQLHLYLPEDVARRVRAKAQSHSLSVSRYLAELVLREVGDAWPAGFWDEVVGGWDGERIPRPQQGSLEQRDPL